MRRSLKLYTSINDNWYTLSIFIVCNKSVNEDYSLLTESSQIINILN